MRPGDAIKVLERERTHLTRVLAVEVDLARQEQDPAIKQALFKLCAMKSARLDAYGAALDALHEQEARGATVLE
jgi:hypothetical protein